MAKKKKVATGIVVALILIIAVVAIVWLVMDEPEPAPTMPNACTDAKYKCVSKGALTIEDACNEDGGLVPQDSLSSECGTNQVCCKPKTCANTGNECVAAATASTCTRQTSLDGTCESDLVCCEPTV